PLRYIQLLLETLPSRAQDDSLEDLMPWAVKG
ncbi:MAG: hypothetical protein RL497_730, partial [Pseudomonadota bacterium]